MHVKIGFEAVVENHNGLSHEELTFLMNSLFGGFNCAVGETGGGRVQRERGGKGQGSVHCAPRDEVDN